MTYFIFHLLTCHSNPNPFVQTTVSQALSYLRLSSIPPTRITIHADNAYYSQPPSSPRFNYLGVPISRAHKTGLGSSAALVTSLTACLLRTFTGSFAPLHNLAQSAHCAAQGKIGSGFDVSAAVHGSHVYHRFSPSCLESGGLREQVDGKWDHEVEATKVPKGLRLVMGDVDCGSSTPGMVRKVLAWRGSDETAEELWRDLEGRNTGLIELMAKAEERSREDGEEWQSAVKTWGTGEEAETESMKLLNEISKQVGAIREKIREMGSRAEVPIEPEAQTKLLDAAAAAVPGVLGGVVPGAGGYDAVVFLCVDRDETVEQLEEFLRGYKFVGEDGKGGSVAVLEAREEMEGVRVEDIAQY